MSSELHRIKKRKKTLKLMDELMENAKTTLVIHYSCESFYDKTDGKTPRITTIAVRNLDSAQTDSFSIHQLAEEKKLPFDDIDNNYDLLEKEMLDRYFEHVSRNQHFYWVHWNMRDVNYGFAAIEHRYRVLGGTPILIPEDRKFDLSRALVDLYGIGYIGHPRLGKIIEKNKISDKDMLSGADEAKAFEEKEFVKLHQSTLRKVDILSNLVYTVGPNFDCSFSFLSGPPLMNDSTPSNRDSLIASIISASFLSWVNAPSSTLAPSLSRMIIMASA